MSLSTASTLLHAFLPALLLAATVVSAAASIPPVEHGDVINTTTTFTTNSSSTTSFPADDRENFEQYLCFLCSGRDLLAIHHCPIYWDYCHLICDDDDMSSATTVPAALPAATTDDAAPAAPVSSSSSSSPAVGSTTTTDHDDCYVMKLYVSGRYVIVEHRPCKYIAWCYLVCGGGELEADRRKVAMGGAATTTAVSAVTAAAIQGSFLPAVELCGTQRVNAPWAPPSAGVVVVTDGDAHRRRR